MISEEKASGKVEAINGEKVSGSAGAIDVAKMNAFVLNKLVGVFKVPV